MASTRIGLDQALSAQRALADAMPVLVMTADADGTVNFFNRLWFEYTGQGRFDRDTERRWAQYIHPEDVANVAKSWAEQVARGSDVVEMDYRLLHAPSRTYRWVTARATALRDDDGAIVQWIGTAIDVDDRYTAGNAIARLAESYQRTSLPVLPAEINGLRFDVAYRSSTRQLTACGDWYDAFPLHEGQTAICIGDVCGHGIEAAATMLKYRQMLRALTLRIVRVSTGDAATILSSVEDAIALEEPSASATAFLGIISSDHGGMTWSSAGHVPPLLLKRDGHTQWLDAAQDLPLGERFSTERRTAATTLVDATAIVLCTDGLVESTRDVIDGMARLEAAVRTYGRPPDLAKRIIGGWASHDLTDDAAVMVVLL